MFHRALQIAVALSLLGCSKPADDAARPQRRWVDLTHDLADDSPFWPTAERFRHEVASFGRTRGGWFYSSYDLRFSEHGGTHLDAPIHFAEGKQTTDQIRFRSGPPLPPRILTGSATIVAQLPR
jgi:hypothetical protein